MREYKFRAWTDNLKDGGEMYYGQYDRYYNITFSPAGYGIGNPTLKIMQYTGLKDKNGKDIYEGDIVLCVTESEDGGIGYAISDLKLIEKLSKYGTPQKKFTKEYLWDKMEGLGYVTAFMINSTYAFLKEEGLLLED